VPQSDVSLFATSLSPASLAKALVPTRPIRDRYPTARSAMINDLFRSRIAITCHRRFIVRT
jgi:hypothetical protein